jgi:nitroreductase
MEVMEAIKERRSIRRFEARRIPDELLDRVLEAGRLAPSSSNVQSWKFKVAKDEPLKSALCKAAMNQGFVEEAPVVIVACLDPEAFGERTRAIVEALKKQGASIKSATGLLRKCESDDEERCLLHAYMNVAIAVENMALEATSLGLGTCWVRAFDPEEVSKVLALPPQYPPAVLLPLGFPAEAPAPRPRKEMDEILLEG